MIRSRALLIAPMLLALAAGCNRENPLSPDQLAAQVSLVYSHSAEGPPGATARVTLRNDSGVDLVYDPCQTGYERLEVALWMPFEQSGACLAFVELIPANGGEYSFWNAGPHDAPPGIYRLRLELSTSAIWHSVSVHSNAFEH